jgi:hypothetical protein
LFEDDALGPVSWHKVTNVPTSNYSPDAIFPHPSYRSLENISRPLKSGCYPFRSDGLNTERITRHEPWLLPGEVAVFLANPGANPRTVLWRPLFLFRVRPGRQMVFLFECFAVVLPLASKSCDASQLQVEEEEWAQSNKRCIGRRPWCRRLRTHHTLYLTWSERRVIVPWGPTLSTT